MSTKKILVVEKDEVILVLIAHILTRQSYVVRTTADAVEADELLRNDVWDAVLLDLRMPNGGIELIRKIEERDPTMLRRVILVTGAVHEAEKLADLPLHATVRKPFEVTSLIETVRSCVDRS